MANIFKAESSPTLVAADGAPRRPRGRVVKSTTVRSQRSLLFIARRLNPTVIRSSAPLVHV